MTPKQQRFVEEYLIDLNATAAYRRAGYTAQGNAAEVNASRLLRNAKIAPIIAEALKKRSEEAQIDAAWVLKKAVTLHENAMEAEAYSAAKGALDLIGKHIDVQAFKEQVQSNVRVEYANLSDEELEARIRAHEQRDGERPTQH